MLRKVKEDGSTTKWLASKRWFLRSKHSLLVEIHNKPLFYFIQRLRVTMPIKRIGSLLNSIFWIFFGPLRLFFSVHNVLLGSFHLYMSKIIEKTHNSAFSLMRHWAHAPFQVLLHASNQVLILHVIQITILILTLGLLVHAPAQFLLSRLTKRDPHVE